MTETGRVQQHPIDAYFRAPPNAARMLTDAQIKEAAQRIHLIGGGYDPNSAKYASYELHASDFAEKLTYDHEMTGHIELQVTGDYIIIDPSTTIKLYTAESINLPPYLWAMVIVLGQLFSAGLAAGSTYVDPGSSGEIYISLSNLTRRPIKIPIGAPIARVHFFVLGDSVETPHAGPASRRPVRLRVGEVGTSQELAMTPEIQNELLVRLVWHKLGLYLMLGLFIGLTWATVGQRYGNEILNLLLGIGLPKMLRLIIPAVLLAIISFLSRDVRRTIRQVLRNSVGRVRRWIQDFADG